MKRSKIITILSLTVFCCLLLSTAISLFSMRKISQENTTAFLRTLSSDVYHSVSDRLIETIDVARTVANDNLLMDILENEENMEPEDIDDKLAAYAERLKDTFSYSWVFIVSDKSKAYYSDTGLYRIIDPENESDDEWYRTFVDSGKEYNLTIGPDNDNPEVWTVFIDVRIEDDKGKFLGVGGIALEIYNLQDLIRDYEQEYGIEIVFIDDEGQPQLESSDIEEYANKTYSVPDSDQLEKITMDGKFLKPSYTITRYVETLDWYMIIHDINPYDYTADWMVIGLNIIIFAILLIISIISVMQIRLGAGTLFSESYIDTLTGIYNRRAYDDTLGSLMERDNLNDITVVVFDVNGLKRINDKLGHAAGDELIRTAAKFISDCFSQYGKCFRIGGDEFVAILNKPVANIDAVTAKFESAQAAWTGIMVKEISISYGYVCGNSLYDCSIDKMIYLADEQMYKRKKKYYNNVKNNRREK